MRNSTPLLDAPAIQKNLSILVAVLYLDKRPVREYCYSKFFKQLPLQSLGYAFSRFDFSARKFPKSAMKRRSFSLRYENFTLLIDDDAHGNVHRSAAIGFHLNKRKNGQEQKRF